MKQLHVLRYILGLIVLMMLVAACTTSSQQSSRTPPATPSGVSPSVSPGASPPASVEQLRSEGTLPTSCPATPIYLGGKANTFVSSGIPWVQAQPTSSGITGHLFYTPFTLAEKGTYRFLHTGGANPVDGTNMKILWTIEHPSISEIFQINGTNLSSPGKTFHQIIDPGASSTVVLSQSQYPSIVVVPSTGCWQLRIISGQANGTITMWVV